MSSSHMQRIGPWWVAAIVLWGCGGDTQPADDVDTSGPVDIDVDDAEPPDGADADAEEVEVRYTGHLCDDDEQCSTGLCYGVATAQGVFEPAKCQAGCLDLFDFTRYCDSDKDCCRGRCCVGCGGQEGLCVLQ